MGSDSFRKAGYAAVDRICDYYASLSSRPVSAAVQPGFLSSSIPLHPPTIGEAWENIDNDYHSIIMPGITHWQHPNFYGYFPCNASFEGAIADLYCASISNPGFNWSVSPSVTELEILMVDWVGRMLGGLDGPVHPFGQPVADEPADSARAMGIDLEADPTWDEVVAAWESRRAMAAGRPAARARIVVSI